MWILNIPFTSARDGSHRDPGPNAMIIQITDPIIPPPTPRYPFKEAYEFRFLDAEDCDEATYGEDCLITDQQAIQLVQLLTRALDQKMNVIVHCHAGLCRSGAVVEVGVMMGFEDTGEFRQPNMRVKTRMIKALGLSYD